MAKDRYVLSWMHGDRIEKISFQGQMLNPFASDDGRIRFELVSNGQSRMMEFNPLNHEVAQLPSDAPAELEGGAKVSPDGKWEAFAAELGGSQQIWVRHVATGKAEPLTGGRCNSIAPEWELDSGSILFASDCGRAYGLPSLYRVKIPAM
jgi:hypothetical protein